MPELLESVLLQLLSVGSVLELLRKCIAVTFSRLSAGVTRKCTAVTFSRLSAGVTK